MELSQEEISRRFVSNHAMLPREWEQVCEVFKRANANAFMPMRVWDENGALSCECSPTGCVYVASFQVSSNVGGPSGVGICCTTCGSTRYVGGSTLGEAYATFNLIVEAAMRGRVARVPLLFSPQVDRYRRQEANAECPRLYPPFTNGLKRLAPPPDLALFTSKPATAEDSARGQELVVAWTKGRPVGMSPTITGRLPFSPALMVPPTPELPAGRYPAKITSVDPTTGEPVELAVSSSFRQRRDLDDAEFVRSAAKRRDFLFNYGTPYSGAEDRLFRPSGKPPSDWIDTAALAERALTLLTSAGQVHDFVGTRVKQHAADCRACRGAADAKQALTMLRALQNPKRKG
jgi:hypothetical protein